jgi:hypothetical protein
MNFDPSIADTNFDPQYLDIRGISAADAEALIMQSILEGSGGPDNLEITPGGLRFVRHLLAIHKRSRQGLLPNFKNMHCVQEVARNFIERCGSGYMALHLMHSLMQDSANKQQV